MIEKPKIIKDVFSEDIAYLLKKNVHLLLEEKHNPNTNMAYDGNDFHRWGVHNDPFFVEIHHMINERFCNWTGLDLQPSYVYGSFYLGNGICPPHVDRPQCELTLDYCVSQNETWPIYVNHVDKYGEVPEETLYKNAEPYILEENDGLILSGTQHWHYRDRIKETNNCNLLFFHFVGTDFAGYLT